MADLSNNSKGEGAPTGEDAIRQAVENSKNSDESQDDGADDSDEDDADGSDDDSSGDDAAGDGSDDADDDSDDDADDSDEDDDDAESDDKKDPKSDRKFSQFKGDGTDKAYISNLEEGYRNSSAEAIRLKGEAETAQGRLDTMLRVVAADPALSKALNDQLNGKGGSGSGGSGGGENPDAENLRDPFMMSAQTEWQEKSEKEIQGIIDANPEIVTDPDLAGKIKHYMKLFSEDYLTQNKKLMSGGDAMIAAMKHLGIEDKRQKQDLAQGAKKNLTPPRSRGNKAKKSGGQKPKFTDDQIAMAKSMGKDQAWLEKNAVK
jgi:hypothetical protein